MLTTNVDHCFQKAGFDKKRLFYTQGDYGLFQSVDPTINRMIDNEAWVMQAMTAQGFVRGADGVFTVPEDRKIFLRTRTGKVLYLELGVGFHTPVIIKYPFWKRTAQNPQATYACINYGEADCPPQIKSRSVCIDGDIDTVLRELQK